MAERITAVTPQSIMLGESVIVRAACGYVVVGEGQWKAMPSAQWGVIGALADPACMLDRRGQLRRANAAFLRLLGIAAAGSGAKALQGPRDRVSACAGGAGPRRS